MCFGLIGSFLDEKGSKKLEKRLKVDIVETLTETIMEGIQERIDNSIEQARMNAPIMENSSDSRIVSLTSKSDNVDLKLEELEQKISTMSGSIDMLSESSTKTTDTIRMWNAWKDAVLSFDEWLLIIWGSATLNTW